MKNRLHRHPSVPTAPDAGDEKMSRLTDQVRSFFHRRPPRSQKKVQRFDQLSRLLKNILHEFCHWLGPLVMAAIRRCPDSLYFADSNVTSQFYRVLLSHFSKAVV